MRALVAVAALAALTACSAQTSYSRSSVVADERPGLGTTFGETRSSPIREVSFERASSRPFAQGTLFYDDLAGVDAAAGPSGISNADVPEYGGVETAVVDERGGLLETVQAAGRIHVVGQEGQRYGLRMRNRTSRRIEVVSSVDGLDVIDGQRASVEKRGYLLEPHATLLIDGFRQSLSEVAVFRFGAVSESYAARSGDDRAVGVIGFAFFAEKRDGIQDEERSEDALRRLHARPFADARFAQPLDR